MGGGGSGGLGAGKGVQKKDGLKNRSCVKREGTKGILGTGPVI